MDTKEAKQSVQMDKALFDLREAFHWTITATCDTARTGYDRRLRNAFYYRGRRSRSFTGRLCDSYSGSTCDVCIDDIDSVISVY